MREITQTWVKSRRPTFAEDHHPLLSGTVDLPDYLPVQSFSMSDPPGDYPCCFWHVPSLCFFVAVLHYTHCQYVPVNAADVIP